MKSEAVNRLWSTLGLIALSSTFTGALRTRGTPSTFAFPGLGSISTADIVVWGVPVMAALVLLLHWLLRECARSHARLSPTRRLPVAVVKPASIDPDSRGGRAWLWGAFVAFAVLPVLLLIPQLLWLLNGTVFRAQPEAPFVSGLAQFWPFMLGASPKEWFGDHYRFERGPTYFIGLTPYLNTVLVVWCAVSLANLRRYYRLDRLPPGGPSRYMLPPRSPNTLPRP